jgi:DNA uptake protein ComE-like DNA-binding protein
MLLPRLFPVPILACCFLACVKQNPDELRQKTANATAEIKQNAKAVAEGVRDGLKRDQSLDLNDATKEQLAGLPGITNQRADKIIGGRPYASTHELVTKGVLSATEYDRIKGRVTVGKRSPSMR